MCHSRNKYLDEDFVIRHGGNKYLDEDFVIRPQGVKINMGTVLFAFYLTDQSNTAASF